MNKGNSLHDAIRKHGIENFDVLELEKISCKTKESLCRRLDKQEIYWIDYYDTFHGDGYNESAGVLLVLLYVKKNIFQSIYTT